MFRTIVIKIKEKFAKLKKEKNTNDSIELLFDNTDMLNIKEEIPVELKKEINECLNFVSNISLNIHEFDLEKTEKVIKLIDKYLNKYRNEKYSKYIEVRKFSRKLDKLKSDMLIKMWYGEEKTELNIEEKTELNKIIARVEKFRKDMNMFGNSRLQEYINIIDNYLAKYRSDYYVKYYKELAFYREQLNSVKSDIITKMFDNEEQEKVYLKCS